jgi:hypothetical protein
MDPVLDDFGYPASGRSYDRPAGGKRLYDNSPKGFWLRGAVDNQVQRGHHAGYIVAMAGKGYQLGETELSGQGAQLGCVGLVEEPVIYPAYDQRPQLRHPLGQARHGLKKYVVPLPAVQTAHVTHDKVLRPQSQFAPHCHIIPRQAELAQVNGVVNHASTSRWQTLGNVMSSHGVRDVNMSGHPPPQPTIEGVDWLEHPMVTDHRNARHLRRQYTGPIIGQAIVGVH